MQNEITKLAEIFVPGANPVRFGSEDFTSEPTEATDGHMPMDDLRLSGHRGASTYDPTHNPNCYRTKLQKKCSKKTDATLQEPASSQNMSSQRQDLTRIQSQAPRLRNQRDALHNAHLQNLGAKNWDEIWKNLKSKEWKGTLASIALKDESRSYIVELKGLVKEKCPDILASTLGGMVFLVYTSCIHKDQKKKLEEVLSSMELPTQQRELIRSLFVWRQKNFYITEPLPDIQFPSGGPETEEVCSQSVSEGGTASGGGTD
eukprot:GHVP01066460.1.p1 GENE.GHVP01066460.1~~GHVP01066460.1.p1  ORF type:complete len:272 (+),score=43.09 GHVP01066460.1:39-818(+)